MTTLPSRPPLYRFYCWSDSDFAFEWILPLILWCREANLLQPIRGTTQIWAVIRHQYGISAPVLQTSIRGEISGRRLFSKALLFREGPGGPTPLIFRPKWGPKGGKKFFWRPPPPPLISGSGWPPHTPPPPPLSEGLDSPLIVVFIFLWIPAGNNHEHHRSLWSCHYSSWHILSTRYNKLDVFLS